MDGISITTSDPSFPRFEIGRRYLLFVSFDEQRMVGKLKGGPWGTFIVNSNDKLEPVNARLRHPLRERLAQQFEDSLPNLRVALKTRN